MSDETPSFTNEQAHLQLVAALRESEILRELAKLLASSLDLNHILQVLVKRTTDVCGVQRCSVWLLENSRRAFIPATYYLISHNLSSQHVQAADSIWYRSSLSLDDPVLHRLLEKGTIILDDLGTEPTLRIVAEKFLVRSVMLVALVREGRPVGMLSLDDPGESRTFSLEQQQLVRAIGQQAAIAIDNARLYQQAQEERKRADRLIERARAIYEVAMAVNSGKDLSEVLEIAARHLVNGLDADGGAIALLDGETLRLVASINKLQAQQNLLSAPTAQTTVSLADLPNCLQAATDSAPLFVTAAQVEGAEKIWYHTLGLDNVLIVPLMEATKGGPSHTSHCAGFAFVHYHNPDHHPSRGQRAFAQDIAAQCALAIAKARLLAEARQAAALATERANTLNAVFHAMTEGITVLSQDGRVLLHNSAAAHFLGKALNSQDRLKDFLQRQSAHTLDGQPITAEYSPLVRALHGEPIRGERFVTKRVDGAERILELNIAPVHDASERQIGVVSAFRDITEQMRIEQYIRRALETMLHVAEAVSGITDIQDILRSVLTMALTALSCDRGLVQLYDEKEATFTPLLSVGFDALEEEHWITEQKQWFPPDTDASSRFHADLMQGHATLIHIEQYLHLPDLLNRTEVLVAPITHRDHLLGLLMLDRSPITGSDIATSEPRPEFTSWDMAVIEGIAQLAGLAIEQTHWQQEAINARASETAMREANMLKDEFLAITAHEFRTPLTIILAHSQIILRSLRKTTDQEKNGSSQLPHLGETLSVIEEQTRQLTNIVSTFLEVTQINRGQLQLKLEEVDLAEIAKQVVTNYSAASADHEISCIVEPSEHPYLVKGDNARLLQIITNLVQNAIKYSPLGGPVTVSLRRRKALEGNANIEVCVEDNGIGIPKEAQPRLFERFYRAPNAQDMKAKGIGLGLYLVAELLHMHGGAIRVESSGVFGEGSRFIFTLPMLERETIARV
jgi:PAS domain S-box-containing protein